MIGKLKTRTSKVLLWEIFCGKYGVKSKQFWTWGNSKDKRAFRLKYNSFFYRQKNGILEVGIGME